MSAPAPERRHPHVLTLDDVAILTGKPTATVVRWATAGTIPGVRFGRARRFWAPPIAVALHGPDAADTVPALPARHVEPGMLTSHGLARVLDLPPANINRLVRAGVIPATRDLRWTIPGPGSAPTSATGRPLVAARAQPTIHLQGLARARTSTCAGLMRPSSSSPLTGALAAAYAQHWPLRQVHGRHAGKVGCADPPAHPAT